MTSASVRIRCNDQSLHDLHDWLCSEQVLQGRVQSMPLPPQTGHMGAVSDVLVAALGAGGAGAVLVEAINTWIRYRRPSVTVTVETAAGDKISITGDNLPDATKLFVKALDAASEAAGEESVR